MSKLQKTALILSLLLYVFAAYIFFLQPYLTRKNSAAFLSVGDKVPYMILLVLVGIALVSIASRNFKIGAITGMVLAAGIIFGSNAWHNRLNQQILEEGSIETYATITSKESKKRLRTKNRRSRTSYYFGLEFKTKEGKRNTSASVSQDAFRYYREGDSIKIKYAEKNPEIFEFVD